MLPCWGCHTLSLCDYAQTHLEIIVSVDQHCPVTWCPSSLSQILPLRLLPSFTPPQLPSRLALPSLPALNLCRSTVNWHAFTFHLQRCRLPGLPTGNRSFPHSLHTTGLVVGASSHFLLLFKPFPLNQIKTIWHSCHLILPPLPLRQTHAHPITFSGDFGSGLTFFCISDPTNHLRDLNVYIVNPMNVLD